MIFVGNDNSTASILLLAHDEDALKSLLTFDKNELEAAQRYLEQAALHNIEEFIKSLSDVLFAAGNSSVVRKAAGLQIKNMLTSKDQGVAFQYQQRWMSFVIDVRNYVKKNVLGALGTETMRPSQVAQCVAYIAVIELPHQQWPDLIQTLTQNVTNVNSTEMMKESTLEAIGYICQDIDPAVLSSQSNAILTAIVHGMKKEEPSNHVKLAATNALNNSLEFTRVNFEMESERHFIMQVVCEASQSTCSQVVDLQVRVAALQCLVKIMSLYYQYMEHYMGPALFAITLEAMKSDVEEEALQGIEFWSNVCEEEIDLAIDASDAAESGNPPENISMHYAKGALPYLVPVLMQTLTKQEEFDDDDDWNPCKAAGVCLMSLANCCEDDIVQYVLPFVNNNVENNDWRYRDAAVMAFGSILSGPDATKLKPLVDQAMPVTIKLMGDSSVTVRDTTAWVIGRVCQTIPSAVVNTDLIQPLLNALVEGLSAEPRVATNVCWAFSSLSEACYEDAQTECEEAETYIMSAYFDAIVTKLLETTDRPDGNQGNLRSSAYEALMEMIKNSPKDCYITVQKTTMTIIHRLDQILKVEVTGYDMAQMNDLQSLLCATLQSVLRKVTKEDAPQISDSVMNALLKMFASTTKSGGVQEDALMAVSTLVEGMFISYWYQVCLAAIGLTSDLCRAVNAKFAPYCDEIMNLLLGILCNTDLDKAIKPQILSLFADIALAIGSKFDSYMSVVLQTLHHASMVQIEKTDFDMIDYMNSLRQSCLECYSGIVHCFKNDPAAFSENIKLLESEMNFIVQFVIASVNDPDHSEELICNAIGLIGDLATTFGVKILPLLDREPIHEILGKGRYVKQSKTRSLAIWATKELRRLKNAVNNSTNNPAVVPLSW
ncbi:Importin subunit beta-1 [Nymphon striatum]|nr:Importin subunit beta-1 [Nymphon striatum]